METRERERRVTHAVVRAEGLEELAPVVGELSLEVLGGGPSVVPGLGAVLGAAAAALVPAGRRRRQRRPSRVRVCQESSLSDLEEAKGSTAVTKHVRVASRLLKGKGGEQDGREVVLGRDRLEHVGELAARLPNVVGGEGLLDGDGRDVVERDARGRLPSRPGVRLGDAAVEEAARTSRRCQRHAQCTSQARVTGKKDTAGTERPGGGEEGSAAHLSEPLGSSSVAPDEPQLSEWKPIRLLPCE